MLKCGSVNGVLWNCLMAEVMARPSFVSDERRLRNRDFLNTYVMRTSTSVILAKKVIIIVILLRVLARMSQVFRNKWSNGRGFSILWSAKRPSQISFSWLSSSWNLFLDKGSWRKSLKSTVCRGRKHWNKLYSIKNKVFAGRWRHKKIVYSESRI